MKIRNIELAAISRYRGELMGLAIIFVILFHVSLPRTDMFFGLRRIGNIGVDMFFFLSGMGLWFAWTKALGGTASQPSMPLSTWGSLLRRFYLRRFLRIYPTWLLVATAFYVPGYVYGSHTVANFVDLIGDITINWDFWLHDELTFWYIPATMAFYILAPFYMELIRRHPVYRWLPVVMMAWCVAVQYVVPINQSVGHIEIFWSRMPVFFIGINMGEAVRRKDSLEGQGLWLLLLVFATTLATCIYLEQARHGRFPLFIERMLYIPLTVTALPLISRMLEQAPRWLNACLRFVGGLSLELYLVHAHFILNRLERLHLGYWPTFLACMAASLPVAWLLGRFIAVIIKTLKKP